MRKFMAFAVFVPSLFGVIGCGESKYTFAPVTGKVTLNGKPLEGASVEFQPLPPSAGVDPGTGSMAVTDKEGRFTLKSQLDPNTTGAVVGKHQIRIYLYTAHTPGEDRDADAGGDKKKAPTGPTIPTRYNSSSTLQLEVPAGGLADHQFQLTSP